MEKSIMSILTSPTIRGIVKEVNENGIKKEDIVSLIKERDQFILIYYK